jgi:hypothetical protein
MPIGRPRLVEDSQLRIARRGGPILAFNQEDVIEHSQTRGIALVPKGNVDLLGLERVERISCGDGHPGDQLEKVDDELLEGASASGRRGCVVAVSQELGDSLPVDRSHDGR